MKESGTYNFNHGLNDRGYRGCYTIGREYSDSLKGEMNSGRKKKI